MSTNAEFEQALNDLKPQIVILFEPILEFMRAIEIFNAERHLYASNPEKQLKELEVYILNYKNSSEFREVIANIENEKKIFQ